MPSILQHVAPFSTKLKKDDTKENDQEKIEHPFSLSVGIRFSDEVMKYVWGCGNNADGFLVEPVENQNDLLNVRGSNFLHTCIREAHYSTLVSSLLEPIGIPCANTPRGWYTYKLHDDPIPKVIYTLPVIVTHVTHGVHMTLSVSSCNIQA